MKYYAIYNEETQELSKAQCKQLNAINIEISEEIYNDFERYTYIDGQIVIDEEFDIKQEAKRQEKLAMLKLTKREVFLALYKDKGITPAQIKAQIPSEEALIEFEYANEYYRGNPLIDMVGSLLGYTKEQLDYLFENKEFPTTEENSEVETIV